MDFQSKVVRKHEYLTVRYAKWALCYFFIYLFIYYLYIATRWAEYTHGIGITTTGRLLLSRRGESVESRWVRMLTEYKGLTTASCTTRPRTRTLTSRTPALTRPHVVLPSPRFRFLFIFLTLCYILFYLSIYGSYLTN